MEDFTGSPHFSSSSFDDKLEESEEAEDLDFDGDSNCSSWIEWFCSFKGHEYFVMVDEDYIKDDFNLKDLDSCVSRFKQALHMIVHCEFRGEGVLFDEVEKSAVLLYGLVHARFILTQRGLSMMQEKYSSKLFGKCPNASCDNTPVLPIGLSPSLHQCSVKIFCPICKEVYNPPVSSTLGNLDGAFFGPSFPHIFFMLFPIEPSPLKYYVPKIFGFRVHRKVKDYYRNYIMRNGRKISTPNSRRQD